MGAAHADCIRRGRRAYIGQIVIHSFFTIISDILVDSYFSALVVTANCEYSYYPLFWVSLVFHPPDEHSQKDL